MKLISKHHNNLLAGHFNIKKTHKLVAQKYHWPILYHNIENYMKGYNIYLALITVWQKFYSDLQSLLMLIYC